MDLSLRWKFFWHPVIPNNIGGALFNFAFQHIEPLVGFQHQKCQQCSRRADDNPWGLIGIYIYVHYIYVPMSVNVCHSVCMNVCGRVVNDIRTAIWLDRFWCRSDSSNGCHQELPSTVSPLAFVVLLDSSEKKKKRKTQIHEKK